MHSYLVGHLGCEYIRLGRTFVRVGWHEGIVPIYCPSGWIPHIIAPLQAGILIKVNIIRRNSTDLPLNVIDKKRDGIHVCMWDGHP